MLFNALKLYAMKQYQLSSADKIKVLLPAPENMLSKIIIVSFLQLKLVKATKIL